MVLSSQWNFAVSLAPRTEGAVGKETVAESATVVTGIVVEAGAPEIVAGLPPFESVDAIGGTILMVAVVNTVPSHPLIL